MSPLGVDRDFVGEGTQPVEMCPLGMDRDFVGEGTQPGQGRVPADLGDTHHNLGPRGPGAALTLIHQTHRG